MENGAVISDLAHKYIHSLPREDEEVINNMLREYKACKVEFVDELELDYRIRMTTIEIPDRPLKKDKKKEDDGR